MKERKTKKINISDTIYLEVKTESGKKLIRVSEIKEVETLSGNPKKSRINGEIVYHNYEDVKSHLKDLGFQIDTSFILDESWN